MADFPTVVRKNLIVLDNSTTPNTTSMNTSLWISANDAVKLPTGNTGQRPSTANGAIRYNQETGFFEGNYGGTWANIGIRVYDTANNQLYP